MSEKKEEKMDNKDNTLHDISGKMMVLQFCIEKLDRDPSALKELLPKMKKSYKEAVEILEKGKAAQKKEK